MRWLPTAALVLLVIVVGGAVAIWLLNDWAAHQAKGLKPPDLATLRLDAIKTALTVAAALGALVTLLITLRRQSISERGQRFLEQDARRRQDFAEEDGRQQRITSLYVAAVEQLGNEKAAVRLGGLYALERLGQDNRALRQTVVDVICAYLRMPYTPPIEILRANAPHSPQYPSADTEPPDAEKEAERRQELQVRLTAQRLLRGHTRPGDGEQEVPTYWRAETGERMNLDLTGATVIDFDLSSCHTGHIRLATAQFHRAANLSGAQFHQHADLSEAHFHGTAYLIFMQFHRNADLRKAQFHGRADLFRTQFHRGADLEEAQFHQDADLRETQFHGPVGFTRAQFHQHADLRKAQFHNFAALRKAQFLQPGLCLLQGAAVTYPEQLPDRWQASNQTEEGLYVIGRASEQPKRSGPESTEAPRPTAP